MKRKTAFLYACIICMTLSACAKGEQKDEAIEVQIESIDTEAEETNASTSSGQTAEATVQQPTKERKPIRVAVMGVPAEEILKKADESLINSNYLIEPVICTDYDQPNAMVLSGEADASLYENQVFLDSYNKKNSTDLEIAERIYYEPLALFGGSISDLSSITNNVKVAVRKGDVVYKKADNPEFQDENTAVPKGYEKVQVELGLNDGEYIEILSGITENDIVLVDKKTESGLFDMSSIRDMMMEE